MLYSRILVFYRVRYTFITYKYENETFEGDACIKVFAKNINIMG